jgi:hypothetical protein
MIGCELTDRVHCMANNNLHQKKGPHRMATAYKPQAPEEVTDQQLDAMIKQAAEKANRVIQKARSKMTPQDRERADNNANAILEDASASAKRSQRGA